MSVVLITGANRGLGFELTRQYVSAAWRVLATCRDPGSALRLKSLTQDSKDRLSVVRMDVTDAESIRRAAAEIDPTGIDVLINCAGISGPTGQTTGSVDYAAWAEVLDVNTMGPQRVIEAFVGRVAQSERKLVVTITSGMGSLADNTSGGSVPYRTSKAAVNMVMRTAAIDLAPRRISCVLINPGWVRTDMGGRGATLIPEESVTAMRALIDRLGSQDSGKFFHYDGREYPW